MEFIESFKNDQVGTTTAGAVHGKALGPSGLTKDKEKWKAVNEEVTQHMKSVSVHLLKYKLSLY